MRNRRRLRVKALDLCVHIPDACYNISYVDKPLEVFMSARIARVDIRTTEAAKATLESAADYLGTTTSAFILKSAMEKATLVLQQAQTIQLTAKEQRRFLAALENPPEPNDNLKRLFKKHQSKSK